MKNELRKQRELIIFNLYQKDIFESIGQTFVSEIEDADVLARFEDVNEHLDDIDDMISTNLYNYTLNRLSFVDRAIIRYATYELMFTELAKEIIVNEAIEITKEFANLDDEKQHKFNNKLLDNIAKTARD